MRTISAAQQIHSPNHIHFFSLSRLLLRHFHWFWSVKRGRDWHHSKTNFKMTKWWSKLITISFHSKVCTYKYNYKNSTNFNYRYKSKKHRCWAWDSNLGLPMVGSDWSTNLGITVFCQIALFVNQTFRLVGRDPPFLTEPRRYQLSAWNRHKFNLFRWKWNSLTFTSQCDQICSKFYHFLKSLAIIWCTT